jgi:rhodanese-related sulfurtransferase
MHTLIKRLIPILLLLTLFPIFTGFAEEGLVLPEIADWMQLQNLLEEYPEQILLLDVRTPAEYEAGHIPGAELLPHSEILASGLELDRDTPIVLYCRSGNRSGQAYRELVRQGFTNLVDFGGIFRWGGEIRTGSEP